MRKTIELKLGREDVLSIPCIFFQFGESFSEYDANPVKPILEPKCRVARELESLSGGTISFGENTMFVISSINFDYKNLFTENTIGFKCEVDIINESMQQNE